MSSSYWDTNAFRICLVVNLASVATKFVTFELFFCEVAVFGRRAWGASSAESTPLLNFLHHRVTDEKKKVRLFPYTRHMSLNMSFACIPRIQRFLIQDRIMVSERRTFPQEKNWPNGYGIMEGGKNGLKYRRKCRYKPVCPQCFQRGCLILCKGV